MANKVSNVKFESANEEKKRVQAKIKRENQLKTEPQTVIRSKSISNGYKKHTIGNSGVTTNTKSIRSNNTSNVKFESASEEQRRVQAEIKRETQLKTEPQTVIRNKSISNGYKKHTIGNGGVATSTRTARSNNTSNIKFESANEEEKRVQAKIKRESRLRTEPQTVIRNKSITNGYKKYTIGNSRVITNTRVSKSGKTGIITDARIKAENMLNSQEDSGSSAIYVGVKAGTISVKSFKKAQAAQPYVSKITKDTGRVITGAVVKSSNGAMKTVIVTRGVVNGTIKLDISKNKLDKFKNQVITGIRVNTYLKAHKIKKNIGNDTKDLIKNWTKWSGKTSIKMIKTNAKGAVDIISDTDDTGLQALALGIKTSTHTYKAVKMTPKIVKKGIDGIKTASTISKRIKKTVYRNGIGVAKFATRLRRFGIKDTIRWQRNQAINIVSKAGKSVVSAIINGAKLLGRKIIIPLIILVVVIALITNIVSAPASAVGVIFGGSFTNKDTQEDIEVRPFLENAVTSRRNQLTNKIISIKNSNLVQNGGKYHFVRLFKSAGEEVGIDSNNIDRAMYTVEEFVSIIEPIFKTIILIDYELEPTQSEIDKTLNDIWNTIVKVSTKDLPLEYCNKAEEPHSCGSYHASESCPNVFMAVHSSYKCSICCSIPTKDKTNSGNTDSEKISNECSGYSNCMGHRILGVYINMDGIYELLAKYFTNEIDRLSNLSTRTEKEQERLDELKSNYELCLDYMAELGTDYGSSGNGSSGGNTDISGVEFVNGKRPNYDPIVSVANMQLGNVGGQPFWSWYGFQGRVEWCACFVSWCANKTGNISNGKIPKFAYCPTGVNWFREHKQWANGNYSEPVAGDIIFFDWDGDGVSDHVGIVMGNDSKTVYTIEGNSGDACRRRSYPIGSSVILGYGLPNY